MANTNVDVNPATKNRRASPSVAVAAPPSTTNGSAGFTVIQSDREVSSFAQAMGRFDSLGVDEVRAAFRIGWSVAQLRRLIDDRLDIPPPDVEPPKLVSAEDLSAEDQVRLRLYQLDVALSVLPFNGHPNTAAMVKALDAPRTAKSKVLLAALGTFEAELVLNLAQAESSIPSQHATGGLAAAVPAGLTKAYEVGRLLSGIVLTGTRETDPAAFRRLLSIGKSPNQRQAVDRAHSLLAELHSSLPAGAAHAVSRHLDEWSDWLGTDQTQRQKAKRDKGTHQTSWWQRRDQKRNPPPRFDLATARLALDAQGDIWQSVLSGQTLGRSYLTTTSYTDAADHLLCHAAMGNQSIVRHFLSTTVGKIVTLLLVVALAVFAVVVAVTVFDPRGTGGKTSTGLAAVLATAGGAGSLVHATRKRLTNLATDVWGLVQSPMIEAELGEAIARATRRLPADLVR